MQFSLDTVRAVTRLLQDSDLAEISIESTDLEKPASRLTVRRQPQRRVGKLAGISRDSSGAKPATNAPDGNSAEANMPGTSGTSAADASETVTVSATAVGVFRASQPALKAGDVVKLGQVVGFVESLKIPNEVIAPIAGEVVEVLAREGQAVEYGQALLSLAAS